MTEYEGLIVKALGGFYYVQTSQGILACRARGVFRKEEISPYVGDRVMVEPTEEDRGYVTAILPRKNQLIRPPVANIDQLVMVVSTTQPKPNYLVLDKLIAIAEYKEIAPVLVVTKEDLDEGEELIAIYRSAGYPVYPVSSLTGSGIQEVRGILAGKITAFTGNTGVGKSSLLNALDPKLELATAHISQKLGRGRHTTRHVELYPVEGGYVADTPGFSAVELEHFEVIFKDQLQYCFREFAPCLNHCKFTGCSHTKEKGCAVLEAAAQGKIAPSRMESYHAMYEDAKKLNEWEYSSK